MLIKLSSILFAALVFSASAQTGSAISYKLVKAGDTKKQLVTAYPAVQCLALKTLTRCELREQTWADIESANVSFFVIDGLVERIAVQLKPDAWDKARAALSAQYGTSPSAEPPVATENELARETWKLGKGALARVLHYGGRDAFVLVTMSTEKALALEAKNRAERAAPPAKEKG